MRTGSSNNGGVADRPRGEDDGEGREARDREGGTATQVGAAEPGKRQDQENDEREGLPAGQSGEPDERADQRQPTDGRPAKTKCLATISAPTRKTR